MTGLARRRGAITALLVAGELTVIVVGVLIALTADAWLEGRREQAAELRHLAFKISLGKVVTRFRDELHGHLGSLIETIEMRLEELGAEPG